MQKDPKPTAKVSIPLPKGSQTPCLSWEAKGKQKVTVQNQKLAPFKPDLGNVGYTHSPLPIPGSKSQAKSNAKRNRKFEQWLEENPTAICVDYKRNVGPPPATLGNYLPSQMQNLGFSKEKLWVPVPRTSKGVLGAQNRLFPPQKTHRGQQAKPPTGGVYIRCMV